MVHQCMFVRVLPVIVSLSRRPERPLRVGGGGSLMRRVSLVAVKDGGCGARAIPAKPVEPEFVMSI